ncbi:MAG: transcriptional repressor [Firmicutes bacterium]|nr:transcriptional repressor [Bacillota bacterium]
MDWPQALRDRGLRATPQRVTILAELAGRDDHPTAEDLYRALRDRHPTLALSTVYSTLETLEAAGLAHRLSLGEGRDRYDANVRAHAHLVCLGCRRVVDVALAPVAPPPEAERLGYAYAFTSVVHHGLCPACRRAGPTRPD